MKFLTAICYILFFIPIVGKFALPILLSNWVLNWFLFGLFSILLPIAYTKSLVDGGGKKQTSKVNEFLVLFCLSIGLHAFSSQSLIVVNNYLNITAESHIDSAQLFEKTYISDAEEYNRIFAQYIYTNDGVSVQFKLDSGEYEVFTPSPIDIKKYQENEKTENKVRELSVFHSEQSLIAMYFTLFQIITFLVIIQIILYLQTCRAKANNKIN